MNLLSYSSWALFSKKLSNRIEHPRCAGFFTKEDAESKAMRLVIGKEGSIERAAVTLYLLIDESDGIIADARFQAFGHPALIGAADAACELLLRKNSNQAKRLGFELIDKHLRDKSEVEAFPKECAFCLNLVLSAIDQAIEQCLDIPFNDGYIETPMTQAATQEGVYPDWANLTTPQKITLVEEVIAADIQPYVELDAGGVQVLNIINDKELLIAYQGSCTSCHSATGATLNAIQSILRAKVHPELIVTPDLSFLQS